MYIPDRKLVKFIPLIALAFVIAAGGIWFMLPKHQEGERGVPRPKPPRDFGAQEKSLKGVLTPGSAKASDIPGSWPWFRGPERSGMLRSNIPLAETWPDAGPKKVWEKKVAKGHAGVAVHKGRVYLHDYDEEKKEDVIRCLSLDNGEEIWKFSYPIITKTNHGITRSVPAVNDKYLVTMGPKAQVYCLDPITGEFKWSKSLVLDYGSVIPKWYSAQCPYLEGDNVVIAPSGPKVLMIKVEAETGKVLWEAENPLEWEMTHSSVVPMKLHGVDTYVYCGSGGVAGVDAESGKILWDSVKWKVKIATCASPLVIDHERVFFSGGYNSGALMMKISKTEKGYSAEPIFTLEEKDFGSIQHTPLFYDGLIYGVRPRGELVCLNLDGSIRWTSSAANRFGIGPFTILNDLMYVMDDHGKMTLVKMSKDDYKPLASAQVLPGKDSWGPMAFVNGLLIVRDFDTLTCLDISSKGNN